MLCKLLLANQEIFQSLWITWLFTYCYDDVLLDDDDDLLNESAIPSSVQSISVSQFVSPQRRSVTRLSERQQQLSMSNGIEGNGHILAQSTPQIRKNASSPVVSENSTLVLRIWGSFCLSNKVFYDMRSCLWVSSSCTVLRNYTSCYTTVLRNYTSCYTDEL